MPRVNDLKVIEVYNNLGCKAAIEFIRSEYKLKYPNSTLTRLRKVPSYEYNKLADKFNCSNNPPFMDLDELYISTNKHSNNRNLHIMNKAEHEEVLDDTLNKLYYDLAIEKLLMITKYVTLNQLTNSCKINC